MGDPFLSKLLIALLLVMMVMLIYIKQIAIVTSLRDILSGIHQDLAVIIESNKEKNRFQLVLKGIKECKHGTDWREREKIEMEAVTSDLRTLDHSFDTSSLIECRRLGEYIKDNKRPRPLLVRLLRPIDVNNFLSKQHSLVLPVTIQPYMTKAERLLLKEKKALKQSGISGHDIKIQGFSLFVKGKLRARVTNSALVYVNTDSKARAYGWVFIRKMRSLCRCLSRWRRNNVVHPSPH